MSEPPSPAPSAPRGGSRGDPAARSGAARSGPADRARAWLVTGPLGRGLAFAIDFAAALRTAARRRQSQ